MEFADTKALVIGTGISGLSAVSLLERKGAQVILFDANEKLKCADVKAKLKADQSGTDRDRNSARRLAGHGGSGDPKSGSPDGYSNDAGDQKA